MSLAPCDNTAFQLGFGVSCQRLAQGVKVQPSAPYVTIGHVSGRRAEEWVQATGGHL